MLIGYDIGSSSVKATLLNSQTGEAISSATCPGQEMPMKSEQPGWAEQDPEMWWKYVKEATIKILSESGVNKNDVKAIGISYQMHGLVLVDKDQNLLRPSIIWCDSRAVEIGNKAFQSLGEEQCLSSFLNSPGNFTASKLKWVKDNEPELFAQVHKAMLPGDYIAMKLTGEINTTISGLSEGIFWDFKNKNIAASLLDHYGISKDVLPDLVPTFSIQSKVSSQAASETGLAAGIPISYRAGDQPNNAFSLNVLNAGEIAATAGTSGVVYGIIENPSYDPQSRVNTFAHVNYTKEHEKLGVLLCINGTGILNSWLRKNVTKEMDYPLINDLASKAPIGSDGLVFMPFGNGAERVLCNKDVGAQLHNLQLNRHDQSHLLRAGQEGIVFALNYGFDIMRDMGMKLNTVRAGHANMFLSPLFSEAFTNITGATVELYNTDGSQGAARGAGVGAGIYQDFKEAFTGLKTIKQIEPKKELQEQYREAYENWLSYLNV